MLHGGRSRSFTYINNIYMVQEVSMTYEEAYEMYMKATKKELASMLAQQAANRGEQIKQSQSVGYSMSVTSLR